MNIDRLAAIGKEAPKEFPEVIRLITAGLAGVAANRAIDMNHLETFGYWIAVIAIFSLVLYAIRVIFEEQQEQTISVIHMRESAGKDTDEWTEEIERQQAS